MKNSHQSIVKNLFICLALALSCACNDKKNKKDDDDVPERSGDEVSSADSKYFDSKPDISSDGSKIVFISNRSKVLKTYKFDVNDTTSNQPIAVTRTDDDVGQEFEVAISPNGTWVAFVALKSATTSVYLKDFANQKSLVTVGADVTGAKLVVSFSSDSQYLLFSARDTSTNYRQTYAVKVNTDGSVSTPTKLSDETAGSAGDEYAAVWVPVAGGASYKVDAKVHLPDTYGTSLVSHTFTTLASVSHATLLSGLDLATNVGMAASESALYFVQKNPSGSGRRSDISIQGTNTLTSKVPVSTGVTSLAPGSTSAETIGSTAIDIVALSSSKDGAMGIWTVTEPLACPDNKIFYDSSLLRFNGSTQKLDRLVIRGSQMEDENTRPYYDWELISDVCDTDAVKEKKPIDGNISFAKVSASSTFDSYSIVYASYFIRDTEIRLMKVENGTAKFYEVSNNLSPYVPK